MLLGIVIHAALFVLPETDEWRWPLHNAAAQGKQTYQFIVDIIHGFRIPVFFLLSGFFSAMLWQRRGIAAFRQQRLKRVGIPWLISCLTVIPLTIWILKAVAIWQNAYTSIYDQITLLITPFLFFGSMVHLWFLWYLLIIAFIFIGLVKIGFLFQNRFWWLLIPASFIVKLFMKQPLTFGSDHSGALIPELPILLYYLCFLLLGVHFYQRRIEGRRWWMLALLPSVPLYALGKWIIELYRSANLEKIAAARSEGERVTQFLFTDPITIGSGIVQTSFTWLMTFALIGLFRWLFEIGGEKMNKAAQYMADSAYWVYIVHLPVVILAQCAVFNLPISHHMKFLLVIAIVSAIGLATYSKGVRYTFIGRMLNGARKRPS